MWEEIELIKSVHTYKIWYVLGNFNAVRIPSERKGLSIVSNTTIDIKRFNEFIENSELLEIPFIHIDRTIQSKSRLDRVLVTDEWLQQWLGCK